MQSTTWQQLQVSVCVLSPQTEDQHNPAPPVDPDHTHLMELAEAPTGMRDSDIRSMKDQLLIETSELLGVGTATHTIPPLPLPCLSDHCTLLPYPCVKVSLFTAEALLKFHGR